MNPKIFRYFALLLVLVGRIFGQGAASFVASSASDNVFVAGNPAQPVEYKHKRTIQEAVNAAGAHGMVIIPSNYPYLSETYTNPNNIIIWDFRNNLIVTNPSIGGGGGGGGTWGSITGILSNQGDLQSVLNSLAPISSLATVATSGNYADLLNLPTIPSASSALPLINGTASAGVSLNFSRNDHVHPTDTTRAGLLTCSANKWLTAVDAAGTVGNCVQPAFSNLSGAVTPAQMVPPGSSTQVMYNKAGSVGADAGLTYDENAAHTAYGLTVLGSVFALKFVSNQTGPWEVVGSYGTLGPPTGTACLSAPCSAIGFGSTGQLQTAENGSSSFFTVARRGYANPASNKCVEVDSAGLLQIAGTNAVCGAGGGGGTPGGVDTNLQYNNLGAFGGFADGTSTQLLHGGRTFGSLNLSVDSITGTLAAARLPNPGASSLGGVQSFAAVSNQFLTQISTAGVVSSAQPTEANVVSLVADLAARPTTTTLVSGNYPKATAAAVLGDSGVASGPYTCSFGSTPTSSASGANTLSGTANRATVWGFTIQYPCTSTQFSYAIATADNTANTYDLGVYQCVEPCSAATGNLIGHMGSLAGTSFAPATNLRATRSWTSSFTFQPGRYYVALTSSCIAACATLYGFNATGVSYVTNSVVSVSAGGTLPATITLPADSPSVTASLPSVLFF